MMKISIKLLCSSINLQHIFRTPFTKNTFWAAASLYLKPFQLTKVFEIFSQNKSEGYFLQT